MNKPFNIAYDVDTVTINCNTCSKPIDTVKICAKRNIKRNNGQYKCHSCRCKENLRPQNTKLHWTDPERKKKHGTAVRDSLKYQEAVKRRPPKTGENNHMWGKKHTDETKAKMSASRTGKIGERATSWKGGKLSFNFRIKGAIQRHYKWFHRVIDRDKKCMDCGITKSPFDAHHIEPLSKIIKRITSSKIFLSDDDKYNFVLSHPDIVDKNLKNGVCLCRSCHKQVHINWGSHDAK